MTSLVYHKILTQSRGVLPEMKNAARLKKSKIIKILALFAPSLRLGG